MPVVDDYTALLSGISWTRPSPLPATAGPALQLGAHPVFLTYSFEASPSAELAADLPRRRRFIFDRAFAIRDFATVRRVAPRLAAGDRTPARRGKLLIAKLPAPLSGALLKLPGAPRRRTSELHSFRPPSRHTSSD